MTDEGGGTGLSIAFANRSFDPSVFVRLIAIRLLEG